MATTLKTPGVYVVEKNAFPNSVVEVETAVPAFIGYTEKASRGDTEIEGTPTRISSLQEFERIFGGAPKTKFKFDKLKRLKVELETRFLLYYSMRLYFDNGGGHCWIVSVGPYIGNDGKPKPKSASELTAPLDGPLLKEMEPTIIVVPDAVVLRELKDWQDVSQKTLLHCSNELMKNRIAILDVYDGDKEQATDPEGNIKEPWKIFQENVGEIGLGYGAAYYPWVNTSIVESGEINFGMMDASTRKELAKKFRSSIPSELPATDKKMLNTYFTHFETIDTNNTSNDAVVQAAHRALMTNASGYVEYVEEMQRQLNLLPPSGGIAGVYARIDSSEGVFRAPANTSMVSVVAPAFNISDKEQERMNVPINGKAINAIRTFPGKGLLIWGARTLDGNSQGWRYISVRRTMIMLKQSIKYAAEANVFEPNNASTWVTVRNMINNFLENKWKAGALMGTKPEDAYRVEVGLGSTMTAIDILDGYMNISVKVALVRPQEFIIITFQQKMQTS